MQVFEPLVASLYIKGFLVWVLGAVITGYLYTDRSLMRPDVCKRVA